MFVQEEVEEEEDTGGCRRAVCERKEGGGAERGFSSLYLGLRTSYCCPVCPESFCFWSSDMISGL